jgi:hypothetical protein
MVSAQDATGHRLPAHMQIGNGTLQLRINDSNARYPLRIDPFVQQGSKLTGSGEISGCANACARGTSTISPTARVR